MEFHLIFYIGTNYHVEIQLVNVVPIQMDYYQQADQISTREQTQSANFFPWFRTYYRMRINLAGIHYHFGK